MPQVKFLEGRQVPTNLYKSDFSAVPKQKNNVNHRRFRISLPHPSAKRSDRSCNQPGSQCRSDFVKGCCGFCAKFGNFEDAHGLSSSPSFLNIKIAGRITSFSEKTKAAMPLGSPPTSAGFGCSSARAVFPESQLEIGTRHLRQKMGNEIAEKRCIYYVHISYHMSNKNQYELSILYIIIS